MIVGHASLIMSQLFMSAGAAMGNGIKVNVQFTLWCIRDLKWDIPSPISLRTQKICYILKFLMHYLCVCLLLGRVCFQTGNGTDDYQA
jgi:hypothetical protein